MVFIRAVENAIFLGTILALGALVDEVLADKLLELLASDEILIKAGHLLTLVTTIEAHGILFLLLQHFSKCINDRISVAAHLPVFSIVEAVMNTELAKNCPKVTKVVYFSKSIDVRS